MEAPKQSSSYQEIITRIKSQTMCNIYKPKEYYFINPFTPTSDQDRISPYNIKQAGDENREEYQPWDY